MNSFRETFFYLQKEKQHSIEIIYISGVYRKGKLLHAVNATETPAHSFK